jgi:CBS domain-containing protein
MSLLHLGQEHGTSRLAVMKVKEMMTRYPERIRPDAPLVETAQKMLALDVGMLIVSEDEQMVGTLTDRDIVVHAIALGASPQNTPVRSVMNPRVICCFEDWVVEEAAALMEENRVRRLPVLHEDGRVIGILSLGDLATRSDEKARAGQVLARVAAPGAASPATLTLSQDPQKPT